MSVFGIKFGGMVRLNSKCLYLVNHSLVPLVILLSSLTPHLVFIIYASCTPKVKIFQTRQNYVIIFYDLSVFISQEKKILGLDRRLDD